MVLFSATLGTEVKGSFIAFLPVAHPQLMLKNRMQHANANGSSEKEERFKGPTNSSGLVGIDGGEYTTLGFS